MRKTGIFTALCMLVIILNGCDTPPPTYETGPYVELDVGVGEATVAITIDSNGEVVLSGNYSQRLAYLGPVGAGWTVGFEKVIREAKNEASSLFILWEDHNGEIWREQYVIGEPFSVTFNNDDRVREIYSEGTNIIVAVEPLGSEPDYSNLQNDIRRLIEKWDVVHHNADRYWDTSDLDSVLRGDALEEQIDSVEWLHSNNCYWEIEDLIKPKITLLETVGSNSLTVDVRKNWDMDLYCNDKKADDDDGYFTVRYTIDRFNGDWYITDKRIVQDF